MEEFISKDFVVKKMNKLKKDWITVCVCVCVQMLDKYYLRYS